VGADRTQQRARWDQARSASADVTGVLTALAPDRTGWTRPGPHAILVVEGMLEHLLADHQDSARVCPHARAASFDRSPQPLVLDVVRGILACVEAGCYARRAAALEPAPQAACLLCGEQALAGQHDLFIAYGPILVAAALCPACRSTPNLRHGGPDRA